MKFLQNRKIVLLVLSLVLLIAVGVGGTLAYLTDKTESVQNTFTPTSVGTEITEDFDETTKSNVRIKNTGDIDTYVRARIVVSWKDSNGQMYAPAPEKDTHYTLETGPHWSLGTDGYYYYDSVLPPTPENGEGSEPLITEATWIKACDDGNYLLHIEIIAEAIQAEPASVVETVWPYKPN